MVTQCSRHHCVAVFRMVIDPDNDLFRSQFYPVPLTSNRRKINIFIRFTNCSKDSHVTSKWHRSALYSRLAALLFSEHKVLENVNLSNSRYGCTRLSSVSGTNIKLFREMGSLFLSIVPPEATTRDDPLYTYRIVYKRVGFPVDDVMAAVTNEKTNSLIDATAVLHSSYFDNS